MPAAEVVYTQTNITIGPNSTYNLDVNNDGVTDFTITSSFVKDGSYCVGLHGDGRYGPEGALSETATSQNGALIGPLSEGDGIGPDQTFSGGTLVLDSFHYGQKHKGGNCQVVWYGPWYLKGGTATGYLGLSFQLNGETYYGWAQLSVNKKNGKGITATLTGYAYETTPGMPINAGQTTEADGSSALSPDPVNRDDSGLAASITNRTQAVSLGTLALGAQVPLLRRRDSAEPAPENS